MWSNINGDCIINPDIVRAKPLLFGSGKPWGVEDLDEMRNAIFMKHVLVLDSCKRADIQCSTILEARNRRRREHLMHRGTHGLHYLRGHVIEANHDGAGKGGVRL